MLRPSQCINWMMYGLVAVVVFGWLLPLLSQKTTGERINSLQEFRDQQKGFNTDEHNRNEAARVDVEKRVLEQIKALDIEQATQDANIKALEGSARDIKGLGVMILFTIPVAAGFIRDWMQKKAKTSEMDLIAHDKIRDRILDRLTALEQSSLNTRLAIPLLTDVADRLSTVLIEGVHHPDDTHVMADDLLDKLPSSLSPSLADLSHEDHKELTGLMHERSVDGEVTERERNMAKQLMPVLDAVRRLRQLEKIYQPQPSATAELIANDIAQRDDL